MNILKKLFGARRSRPTQAPARPRTVPQLESLEGRAVPAPLILGQIGSLGNIQQLSAPVALNRFYNLGPNGATQIEFQQATNWYPGFSTVSGIWNNGEGWTGAYWGQYSFNGTVENVGNGWEEVVLNASRGAGAQQQNLQFVGFISPDHTFMTGEVIESGSGGTFTDFVSGTHW
ncbi:MAG TPA: hypothetical protein VMS17_00310 [Gemmataceae bacterium]|nr:hypothetical protein [Gemmataceae bacterium]